VAANPDEPSTQWMHRPQSAVLWCRVPSGRTVRTFQSTKRQVLFSVQSDAVPTRQQFAFFAADRKESTTESTSTYPQRLTDGLPTHSTPWPLGINLMLWTASPVANSDTTRLFQRLRTIGYSGVEVPLLDLEHLQPAAISRVCDDHDLWRTASTALPPGATFMDPAAHPAALAWIERVCAAAHDLGAPIVCGPLCAPVGELPGRPSTDALSWCAEGLHRAGEIALSHGIRLVLEPINRFESCVATTVDDAAVLLASARSAGLGLMADTFHMNIEERNPVAALSRHAPSLIHMHASENDRGPCGTGHVPWEELFDALSRTGYAGRIVVESFGDEVPQIARACCIWRDLARSADALAAASATFLRETKERTR